MIRNFTKPTSPSVALQLPPPLASGGGATKSRRRGRFSKNPNKKINNKTFKLKIKVKNK